MNTLLIRSLIIGGLLAAGPALVLACDHERTQPATPSISNASNAPKAPSAAKITAKAASSSGIRWL